MLLYLHSQTRKHQHMPRQERTKSGTGIYHVMLRGINKQDIFEDDEDYLQMTSIKTKMITVPWSQAYNLAQTIKRSMKQAETAPAMTVEQAMKHLEEL